MSFANLKSNRDSISKLIQAAEATGGSGEKSRMSTNESGNQQ